MFQDLKERAQLKAENHITKVSRRKEVEILFKTRMIELLPEIEKLGFHKVHLYDGGAEYFYLRLQTRSCYSQSDFTHNLQLSSIGTNINYGYGANSAKGTQMKYDIEWNDSKLIGTFNNALRALIKEALEKQYINDYRN